MAELTKVQLQQQLAEAQAELADKRPGIIVALHGILGDMPQLVRRQVQTFTAFNVDDVYATLKPLLVRHGVIIVPKVLNYEWRDGKFPKGGDCYDFVMTVQYDFIAVRDGTREIAIGFAQGRDNQDKGPNKAIQQALKYVLIQMLQINTGEDAEEDPEATEAAKQAREAEKARKQRESDILHYTNKAKLAVFEMAGGDKEEAKRGFDLALHASGLDEIVTSGDADKVVAEALKVYKPAPAEPSDNPDEAPFE